MNPSIRNWSAIAAVAVLFGAIPVLAVTHSTPAVNGYDVVSYFDGGKPLPGNGNHVAEHDGETYLFVSEAHKRAFLKDPERYVPAYGGYCAYGVSVGKKFVGDPNVWEIVDDRLYLNLDNKIKGLWLEDVPGNIEKAESRWSTIRDTAPSAL